MTDLPGYIQKALQDALRENPALYEPSPGQLMDHVSHRVARVIAEALIADEGFRFRVEEAHARPAEPLEL